MGLSIHPDLKLFICQSCKIALTGNNISNHFHNCHSEAQGIQVDVTKINNIVANYKLLQEMPVINGPIPQVDGLALFEDYVKCPECHAIYSRHSLRMHYSRLHSSQKACQANSLPGIFAQQLDQGANKKLFQVIPHAVPLTPTPTLSSHDLIQSLRSSRNDLIKSYCPKNTDARVISPWLLFTGWHIHTQPYKADDLRKLVAMPKNEGRLNKLNTAVQALFQHAYKILAVTDTLVLQKLNTADPMKDG